MPGTLNELQYVWSAQLMNRFFTLLWPKAMWHCAQPQASPNNLRPRTTPAPRSTKRNRAICYAKLLQPVATSPLKSALMSNCVFLPPSAIHCVHPSHSQEWNKNSNTNLAHTDCTNLSDDSVVLIWRTLFELTWCPFCLLSLFCNCMSNITKLSFYKVSLHQQNIFLLNSPLFKSSRFFLPWNNVP